VGSLIEAYDFSTAPDHRKPRFRDACGDHAWALLERFINERNVELIPNGLTALASHATTSADVTVHYLADLAPISWLKRPHWTANSPIPIRK
jgi:hypothetical protein